MKTILILSALAATAFASPPIQQLITPEALVKLQQIDPVARLEKPAEGDAKAARPQNESIIAQSTILHDSYHWTIVPNGAVIFLPESQKARIVPKPEGKLLTWAEFLARNFSWLGTEEVTIDQAAGKVPLPQDRVSHWSKQDQIIIAVHLSGPISVRPAKPTNPSAKP